MLNTHAVLKLQCQKKKEQAETEGELKIYNPEFSIKAVQSEADTNLGNRLKGMGKTKERQYTVRKQDEVGMEIEDEYEKEEKAEK